MSEKTCTKCGETKALDEFYRANRTRPHCKECMRSAQRARPVKHNTKPATKAAWRRKKGLCKRDYVPRAEQKKRATELAARRADHKAHVRAWRIWNQFHADIRLRARSIEEAQTLAVDRSNEDRLARYHAAKPEMLPTLRERDRKRKASERGALSDTYVKKILCAPFGLSTRLVPKALVEAKRAHMKLAHLLTEKTECPPRK